LANFFLGVCFGSAFFPSSVDPAIESVEIVFSAFASASSWLSEDAVCPRYPLAAIVLSIRIEVALQW